MSTDPKLRHGKLEDIQAMLIGALLVALGITVLKAVGILSGGTTGIGFLIHYLTGGSFGFWYFVINVPFYWLAWRHMGASFTTRTFLAVGLVSFLIDWLPLHFQIGMVKPWLGAILGGILMGNGFLVLFRHHASLGGLGVVALFLQKTRGWRAGYVQLAIDAVIVTAAIFTVPLERVVWSILAVVVLNLVIATNHRPGRYVAQ